MEFRQSSKLSEVCYEIRGPVIEHANALEEAGHSVLRLNTGNPALFGFEAPEEILQDMIRMLPQAHGYTDSRGVLSARRAVAQRYQTLGVEVDVDDVFLGNGVSELVSMAVTALLEDGDEVLIPAPDFPLWTAVTTLAGGKAVHYLCDEQADWYPDLDDMASKITDRTKAVVIINPNNPTGAVYPKEIVEGILDLARRHGLMVLADEIYDQILYDDAVHHSAAALRPDLVVGQGAGAPVRQERERGAGRERRRELEQRWSCGQVLSRRGGGGSRAGREAKHRHGGRLRRPRRSSGDERMTHR
ncbi:Histidinol-phosphate aminotransferase [Streptomyces hirsutus]